MSKKRKAEASEQGVSEHLERRGFLKILLSSLSAVAALEIGGVSLFYLKSENSGDRKGSIVRVGVVEDFPLNSVTKFQDDGFYLIRDEAGDFLAVHQKCPHLGCNVDWQPESEKFVCPCHASSFDKYGELESPPVPRPLDTFNVWIEDGRVLVDTSKVNTREQYSGSQKVSSKEGLQN